MTPLLLFSALRGAGQLRVAAVCHASWHQLMAQNFRLAISFQSNGVPPYFVPRTCLPEKQR